MSVGYGNIGINPNQNYNFALVKDQLYKGDQSSPSSIPAPDPAMDGSGPLEGRGFSHRSREFRSGRAGFRNGKFTTGSMYDVYHGRAHRTPTGLKKRGVVRNKRKRVVSKRKSSWGKRVGYANLGEFLQGSPSAPRRSKRVAKGGARSLGQWWDNLDTLNLSTASRTNPFRGKPYYDIRGDAWYKRYTEDGKFTGEYVCKNQRTSNGGYITTRDTKDWRPQGTWFPPRSGEYNVYG